MVFTTLQEVKDSVVFDSGNPPIPDATITKYIQQVQNEIEEIYKTKFRTIEYDNLHATGVNITDNAITFSNSDYNPLARSLINQVLYVSSGAGKGLYRGIISNDGKRIHVSPALPTGSGRPDATSFFQILTMGYTHDEIHDGTGSDTMFVNNIPLVYLMRLQVDGKDIDTENGVYVYDSGRLVLKDGEVFRNEKPQSVKVDYIYGEYELHPVINRLATVMVCKMVLEAILAGEYKEYDGVSIPGLNNRKTLPHMKLKEAIMALDLEASEIKYARGEKFPGFRPYVIVG